MSLLSKIFKSKTVGEIENSTGNHSIPGHVAIMMDGNGRWATKRGLPRTAGHANAAGKLENLMTYLLDRGVHTVSLYAFSTENWKRSKQEVDFLMNLMTKELKRGKKRFMEMNVRIKAIGRRDNIPTKLLDAIEDLELATFGNTRGTLCLAIDYGGQDEIVRAAQAAIDEGVENLTKEAFNSYLDSGELTPIDLVIRTSGEFRLSNFMLWQMAYSEFAFIPEMWPDMTPKILEKILKDYSTRNRRFGGTKK
ncbi:MAG: polyprenyl diphosphate synthase [Alphaproteobacteria bacterium]|nr:polyprenyl diphosphate synthase [Alphaproteobacteria bacterium]